MTVYLTISCRFSGSWLPWQTSCLPWSQELSVACCPPTIRIGCCPPGRHCSRTHHRCLAASSQKVYTTAQLSFQHFCQSLQVPAMPAGEQVLLLYVADLFQRVCHSTVRSYLAAIRHMHLAHGLPNPLQGLPRLELALKGLKRRKPQSGDSRLPITPLVLTIIGRSLSQHCRDQYDQLMLWAACCLGFFAFLRSGEFTLPGGTAFDPDRHLSPADILVDNPGNPTTMRIHLRCSKMDQTHSGVDLFVG